MARWSRWPPPLYDSVIDATLLHPCPTPTHSSWCELDAQPSRRGRHAVGISLPSSRGPSELRESSTICAFCLFRPQNVTASAQPTRTSPESDVLTRADCSAARRGGSVGRTFDPTRATTGDNLEVVIHCAGLGHARIWRRTRHSRQELRIDNDLPFMLSRHARQIRATRAKPPERRKYDVGGERILRLDCADEVSARRLHITRPSRDFSMA